MKKKKKDISNVQSCPARACHQPKGTESLRLFHCSVDKGSHSLYFLLDILISMLYFSDFESNSQDKTNISKRSLPLLPNKRKCVTCYCLDLLQWDVMKWHEGKGTHSYWIYTWKTSSKCSIDISNFFLNNVFAWGQCRMFSWLQ